MNMSLNHILKKKRSKNLLKFEVGNVDYFMHYPLFIM